jgi:hypothetical protein
MPFDQLKLQRAAVVAAELGLSRARAQMEAVAERNGMSLDGIFGEFKFVTRSTAEGWERLARKEGRAAGESEMIGVMAGVMKAMRDDSPWSHLRGVNFSGLDPKVPTGSASTALARAIVDVANTRRRGGREQPAPKSQVANEIIAAGKRRRGEEGA